MKGTKVDIKELKAFRSRLEKAADAAERDAFYEAAAKELAARLLALVKKRTPVGQRPQSLAFSPKMVEVKGKSGKKYKMLSREGAILSTYWSGYRGGTLRRSWTATEVRKKGGWYEIEIINPIEYASYVEFGHRQTPGRYVPALGRSLKASWVKGQFMLTISEQELQAMTPGILQKKLDTWLKEAAGGGQ